MDRTARVAKHAALADPARLEVVDLLATGDASPSELQRHLGLASNLLAHHLKVLERAGIATRRRSQGDRRRSYVTLVPGGLDQLVGSAHPPAARQVLGGARRLVFVCTANSARSQLATALWRQASLLPVVSAGTHPADRIAPGALAAARRHGLRLDGDAPRRLAHLLGKDDAIVTVCDSAHEELAGRDVAHWAVPDPVPLDTSSAYDAVVVDLTRRITALAAATQNPASQNPDHEGPS